MTVDGYLIKKNDVNVTRTSSKMIMSEGYVEAPSMPTPGHKSIDEILTHERAKPPHQYPQPMPPGSNWYDKGSLNAPSPSLEEYNANEAELWRNG